MNENEIMTNEEVMDVVEEVVIDNPNRKVTLLGAAAVVAGIGAGLFMLTKKVIIPAVKKRKAMKEAEANSTPRPIEVEFESENENA